MKIVRIEKLSVVLTVFGELSDVAWFLGSPEQFFGRSTHSGTTETLSKVGPGVARPQFYDAVGDSRHDRLARRLWVAWTTRTRDGIGSSRDYGDVGVMFNGREVRLPAELPDIAAGLAEARDAAALWCAENGVDFQSLVLESARVAHERYDARGQTAFDRVADEVYAQDIEESNPIPMSKTDMKCIRDGLRSMLGVIDDRHPATGEKLTWDELVDLHDETTVRSCEEELNKRKASDGRIAV